MTDEPLLPPYPISAPLYDEPWRVALSRAWPSIVLWLIRYRLREEAALAVRWWAIRTLAVYARAIDPGPIIFVLEPDGSVRRLLDDEAEALDASARARSEALLDEWRKGVIS